MRFQLALWVSKIIRLIIHIIAPSKGSNMPGAFALKIDPQFVAHFQGVDPQKVLFITGTNGKSSTSTLISNILSNHNIPFINNPEGANLLPGVATALLSKSSLSGNLHHPWIVLETDERSLPLIRAQLPAKNLLVTNLQKDQVQRNGDPDFILRKIKSILDPQMTLYLNGDEPRSKSLEQFVNQTYFYGVEKNEQSYQKKDIFATMACPICYHSIQYDSMNIDNIGSFKCINCGFSSQKNSDVFLHSVDFVDHSFFIKDQRFVMTLPLSYMLYTYAGAICVCENLFQFSLKEISDALSDFVNIEGRYQSFTYQDHTFKYLRIKQENPDTLQNSLHVISEDPEPKIVCLGLYPVLDIDPYYTNTFYTYDCDFTNLIHSNVTHYVCFTEIAGYDTALRLEYAGVPREKITVFNHDNLPEILEFLFSLNNPNIYLITFLATFYELKKIAEVSHENH